MLLDKRRGRKVISFTFITLMTAAVVLSVVYLLREESRPSDWVAPDNESRCPSSHPVKVVFRNRIGAKCVYHFQGGLFLFIDSS
jgi:hypothetical protein